MCKLGIRTRLSETNKYQVLINSEVVREYKAKQSAVKLELSLLEAKALRKALYAK
jgi:hypothetical protein